ncbi:hypothetical protein [Flavobacterium cerinum]|uniref:Uncharacterized protein n=1 Tax=Flavobacterium cerinum TaxID=2502784 RepID=A0A3S3U3B7_9FLAO|nr:hypothetical protein [Flavobacterium cerinum]RWX00905.1 hypothetical protein EPI11_07745 [Flavobacterium cerinum]
MWYKIDWNQFAVNMLPTFLRKPVNSAFAQLFLRAVISIYIKWVKWRSLNLYKLEHTGQVCSLRKSLNDNFDSLERRIYIGEGNAFDTVYIYTEAEAQQVYINDTIYLRTEGETADTGLDFIVWVPLEVFNTEIHGLKAHIEFYKAGGKRYSIFIING